MMCNRCKNILSFMFFFAITLSSLIRLENVSADELDPRPSVERFMGYDGLYLSGEPEVPMDIQIEMEREAQARRARLVEENPSYIIRTGSFAGRSYAEAQQNQLGSDGFDTIVREMNTKTRVMYNVELSEHVHWTAVNSVLESLDSLGIAPLVIKAK